MTEARYKSVERLGLKISLFMLVAAPILLVVGLFL